MAPATWLTFERTGEQVSCTSRTCVFFIVPFKIQRLNQAIEVGHRERAGLSERQREFVRTANKVVHADGKGFLQIHGNGEQFTEVRVSPAALKVLLIKPIIF